MTTSSATATWEGGLRGGKGRITTTASATIDKAGDGFRITRMRLEVRGQVPGIDQAAFAKAAEGAKEGCPVSQALMGNVPFELDARLA